MLRRASQIHDLIVDPSDFYKRTQRYSTAVILSIVFVRQTPLPTSLIV